MIYAFDVTPVPKPRMTKADRWKKRAVVLRYFAFKEEICLKANVLGLKLPGDIKRISFEIEMPRSWSKKKRDLMRGTKHEQRPDLDNLLKAVQDTLCEEDSHIWRIGELKKTWNDKPKIEIECY